MSEICPDKLATRWVVVNTHPHREHIAIENLRRQNFIVYCPMILKRIRHARKRQDISRAMFPGYVFVNVEQDITRWRPILSTVGVRQIVRFGERVAFLHEDFIASLRAREVDGIIAQSVKLHGIGDSVRISGGPFDGVVATIVEMNEKDRLVVLMEFLNGRVKASIDGDKIAPT